MTDQQIEQWKREREIARAIEDPHSREVALQQVYDHKDDMMMECIAHQSNRLKEVEKKVNAIEIDLPQLRQTAREWHNVKIETRGAKILWKILKLVASAGGGMVIMKVLSN